MDLIVCEKPDVAKGFASALGAKWDAESSSFSNNEYRIVALQGHVVSLRGLKDYDPAFQGQWEPSLLSKLPVVPDLMDKSMYTVTKSKMYQNVKKHMLDPAISRVINACDAGREGELIFWEAFNLAGCTKPVMRFWESDALSKEVVLRGLNNLKDRAFFLPRRDAAYARQHADWYLGMNLTVAYTAIAGQLYSVGPVQTPVLAMIANRDELISSWTPIPYDEIEATFEHFKAKFRPFYPKYDDRPYSLDQLDSNEFLAYFMNFTSAVVHAVQSEPKNVLPPKLHSLTTLQIEANEKFGFSASMTLKIAQKLYDDADYKCLSYPRTDSEVVGSSMTNQVSTLAEQLRKHYDIPFVAPVFTKRNVNDSELTDHHALLPLRPLPETASESERKIYNLVLYRFFQAFSPQGLDHTCTITLKVGDKDFEAKETLRAEAGWRDIRMNSDDDSASSAPGLQNLKEGQKIPFQDHPKILHKTIEAPSHYTVATLLKAMSNVANTIKDEELRKAMKAVDGRLGTPATQDSIIDLLIDRGYIEEKKKLLVSTPTGRALIATVAPELKNAVQRARMEQLLNDFTSPDATKQYLQDIHRLIAGNIQYCTEMKPEDRVLPKIDASCPVCHEDLMEAGFRYQCTLSTCDFALPKQYAGHTLKVSEIQALSTHRETGVLTFTKKDSNKKYNAKLRLNDANRLELAFPAPEETQLGYCPKCRKGRVYVKNPSVCVCTECDFVVYRTIAQKALTDKQIQTLLRSGSIPVIKGFKKKDQSTFAAGLKFKDDFKLEFTRPS